MEKTQTKCSGSIDACACGHLRMTNSYDEVVFAHQPIFGFPHSPECPPNCSDGHVRIICIVCNPEFQEPG